MQTIESHRCITLLEDISKPQIINHISKPQIINQTKNKINIKNLPLFYMGLSATCIWEYHLERTHIYWNACWYPSVRKCMLERELKKN